MILENSYLRPINILFGYSKLTETIMEYQIPFFMRFMNKFFQKPNRI